jgi:hypothetical protein
MPWFYGIQTEAQLQPKLITNKTSKLLQFFLSLQWAQCSKLEWHQFVDLHIHEITHSRQNPVYVGEYYQVQYCRLSFLPLCHFAKVFENFRPR